MEQLRRLCSSQALTAIAQAMAGCHSRYDYNNYFVSPEELKEVLVKLNITQADLDKYEGLMDFLYRRGLNNIPLGEEGAAVENVRNYLKTKGLLRLNSR